MASYKKIINQQERKRKHYIRNYTFRQSSFPDFRPDKYVYFGSYKGESSYAVYRIEIAEIIKPLVEYISAPDSYGISGISFES